MPEGDVVWRTARRLDQAFRDRPLIRLELRWGATAAPPMAGRCTVGVFSRGKHLLHRVDNGLTLHTHLRMEGRWRLDATPKVTDGQRRRPDIRVIAATSEWTAFGLRLGMVDLLPTAEEHRLVGHLGPDLLGEDWDLGRAVFGLLAEPGRTVAEALLDQRNLAGIGTLYCAETLFLRGIHPWQPIGELGRAEVTGTVELARRLMLANLDHPVQTTTGRRTRGDTTYVHARSGLPCRRCGQTIRVATLGESPRDRVLFSCPRCQGGLAPTDDGAPQRPLGAGRRPGHRHAGPPRSPSNAQDRRR